MPASPDPFLLLIAALAVLPLALAACLRAPAAIALGFVAVLCLFSASTWGQLQEDNTLYSRGTGLFSFSLLNLLLWVAVSAALMRESAHRFRPRAPSPFPPFQCILPPSSRRFSISWRRLTFSFGRR